MIYLYAADFLFATANRFASWETPHPLLYNPKRHYRAHKTQMNPIHIDIHALSSSLISSSNLRLRLLNCPFVQIFL
jgi:hypothetical protein